MNDMRHYDLNLDGPAFRAQRKLLMKIADLAHRKRPYEPAPGDEGLLEGLLEPDRRHRRPGSRPARHRLPVGGRRGRRPRKETGLPALQDRPRPRGDRLHDRPCRLDDRQGEPAPTKEASSPISRTPSSWKWTRRHRAARGPPSPPGYRLGCRDVDRRAYWRMTCLRRVSRRHLTFLGFRGLESQCLTSGLHGMKP